MVSADVDGECRSHHYDINKSVENEELYNRDSNSCQSKEWIAILTMQINFTSSFSKESTAGDSKN